MDIMDLPQKKFTLIGEIHGVRENLAVLRSLVEPYLSADKAFTLAFEWPFPLAGEINDYISGRISRLSWKKWEFAAGKDGRISKEHIRFLRWVKNVNLSQPIKRKISIICFDRNAKSWNGRDRAMTEILQKAKGNIIAIMGNFHAKKSRFELDKKYYRPLGSILPPTKTVSIKIEYQRGTFYNFGTRAVPKSEHKKIGLFESRDPAYDYSLVVKEAHPVKLLTL